MSDKPITTAELAEMKAREAAATRGPWNDRGEHGVTQTKHITRDLWQIPRTVEDVAFIAHAREDVPRLIAQVERLQALLPSDDEDKLAGERGA